MERKLQTKLSKMKKIGYQGMENSNSMHAAQILCEKSNFTDVELIGLLTSEGVVSALADGSVDYGVVAVKNSVAGVVIETQKATENFDFKSLDQIGLSIKHCLFVKDNSIKFEDITHIASHIQALKQCKMNISEKLPNAILQEIEDTAIGAKLLDNGTLSSTTGVLCPQKAGEAFGLHLLEENMQDNKENTTYFEIIISK